MAKVSVSAKEARESTKSKQEIFDNSLENDLNWFEDKIAEQQRQGYFTYTSIAINSSSELAYAIVKAFTDAGYEAEYKTVISANGEDLYRFTISWA